MCRISLVLAAISLFLFSCTNNESKPTGPVSQATDSVKQTTPPQPNPESSAATPDTASRSLSALEQRHAQVPSDPALSYDLAYAYAEQKNGRAVKLADSLIKAKAPEIEKAFYVKATYYAGTNNTKDALKAYDAAIGANYQFLDAYLDKGRLLFRQKQYGEALKSFARGQKMSPGTAEFYFWVAKTQEAMGDKVDARMNYERAYALDKSMTEAKQAADRL